MSGRVSSAVRRLSGTLRRPWGGVRGPNEPPMVRGWVPFLGCALPFGRDAPGFLRRCQQRHGSAFTVYLMGRRMTFLLDPRDYPAVFKNAEVLSFTPISREIATRAFGYRRVFQSGLTEAQLRETYAHHLRPGTMGPLVEQTQAELSRLLAEQLAALRPGPDGWCAIDLMAFVSRCVFMAGVTAMFGRCSVDGVLHETFVRYDHHFARMVAGVPLRLLGTARDDRESLVELLREPWEAASAFIEERRALVSRYVDDVEAARVRLSMLWASQANTIPAAFWALALLLEEPRALEVIEAEVAEAVQRDPDGRPRLDPTDRTHLRHLDSALLEMLRLCSGGTSIRTVLEPVTLELVGGRRCALRPGDNIAVFPFLSHRDPEIFEDPERFRFDRFYAERGSKRFSKGGERLGFAVVPFGGGETMCPGRFLALAEIKMLVAMVLADYELQRVPGQGRPSFDLSRSGLGILPPVEPLGVRLRRRRAA